MPRARRAGRVLLPAHGSRECVLRANFLEGNTKRFVVWFFFRIRLVAVAGDVEGGWTKERPRQAADERVHGVGPGGEEETRRSVSSASQRRAVEDPRQAVEDSERLREAAVHRGGREVEKRP